MYRQKAKPKLIYKIISKWTSVYTILWKTHSTHRISRWKQKHTKIKRKVSFKSFELLRIFKVRENQCFHVTIKPISLLSYYKARHNSSFCIYRRMSITIYIISVNHKTEFYLLFYERKLLFSYNQFIIQNKRKWVNTKFD